MKEKNCNNKDLGGLKLSQECLKRHSDANKAQESSYIDPDTSYEVFTEYYHLNRGYCCESGCRHCPYGYQSPKSLK